MPFPTEPAIGSTVTDTHGNQYQHDSEGWRLIYGREPKFSRTNWETLVTENGPIITSITYDGLEA